MRALPIRAGLSMRCAPIAAGAGALPARAGDGVAQRHRHVTPHDDLAHDGALTPVAADRACAHRLADEPAGS